MKRILAILLCLCMILMGSGCSGSGNNDTVSTPPPSDSLSDPNEGDTRSMHAVSLIQISEDTLADDGNVIFTRSYQAIDVTMGDPAIAHAIKTSLKGQIDNALESAFELEAIAQSEYTGSDQWISYFTQIHYTPTRIDQAVLSLFVNHSSYSGGTHPSLSTASVTYDLSTGNALTLEDILVDGIDNSSLADLVNQALSPNAEDLWYDYEETISDHFSGNLKDASNWYFSKTGLCFHFEPFMIAPYSAGTIIASIPYDRLDGVLLQKYLPEKQTEADGSISVSTQDRTASTPANIAPVEMDANGTALLLCPDGAVNDVRIEIGTWSGSAMRYITTSTIFAADYMDDDCGILLTVDLTNADISLRLTYQSNSQEIQAQITTDSNGNPILQPNESII